MEKKKVKLSRSIRLEEDTLRELKTLADSMGIGITVYIRKVLEAVVENSEQVKKTNTLIESYTN